MNGYGHPKYVASLAEFGTPRELPHCGGWILVRQIPGTPYHDAMGCYPLFSCNNWDMLSDDLNKLKGVLVSLTLVTDPFGKYRTDDLRELFDVCHLFKKHYITDLSRPIDNTVRKRYKKYARNALKKISIEHCRWPEQYLFEWIRLYNYLIKKHNISGLRTFSESSFRLLLSMPGVELFVARHEHKIIGADIWLVNGDTGYAHLSAMDPQGYELRAPYALYWSALQHFSLSLSWIDHGASAGLIGERDGLSIFKEGWATGNCPVYLCGKILDQEKYNELSRDKDLFGTNYFPAYRKGEYL